MNITILVLILVALFFADVVIRYVLVFKALIPIKHRPVDRQRSVTFNGVGRGSVHIALLGDSVLYGENSRYPLPAIQYVAQNLAKQHKTVVIYNYAVTGNTIDQLIDSQLPKIQESDLIFIYVGANDYFRFTSPRKFLHSVDRLLKNLKGKTVIWCTLADPKYLYLLPIWQRYIYRYYVVAYMNRVTDTLKRHPKENWHTIDFTYEPTRRLKTQKLNSHALIADGFHLNGAGHELWARIVEEAYVKLKQQGARLP
ncbi:MAG TPA: SGNH/GDSL hydrolase family protein [Candidatus Saccharimonadales bacterium]|nr:SGNH/GDSL hydrolase family protein [Candidatus Saccharimonadales bacterium]